MNIAEPIVSQPVSADAFTSRRLLFCSFQPSNLDAILVLMNDPGVQRGVIGTPTIPRPATFKTFLQDVAEKSTLWLDVMHRETHAFVGFCSINVAKPLNREGARGVAIHRDYWNQGYGTEAVRFVVGQAFAALGLHRVLLEVTAGNTGAVALYRKLEEGRKRKSNWVNGCWEDVLIMGVLDEEWNSS
ncbi:acyl-CoA N-acyltransferase [Hygrophoropsis aurantiaca]|uniref:Acyl-CoA N-acyltransferase n=1 Tax=Hygrophoropsis aurantiaca TaxID=72124 RepID=A0ACB8ACP4_9AGAM|nr:acyl-CoA N-acyltransferase [Hygrophoropsis aurantiaca]